MQVGTNDEKDDEANVTVVDMLPANNNISRLLIIIFMMCERWSLAKKQAIVLYKHLYNTEAQAQHVP